MGSNTHTCTAQPCTHVFPPTECQCRTPPADRCWQSHQQAWGLARVALLGKTLGQGRGLGPCPAAAGAPAPSREPGASSGCQGCSSSQVLCLWGSLVAPKFSVVLWTLLSCKYSEGATPAGNPRPRRPVPPRLLTDPHDLWPHGPANMVGMTAWRSEGGPPSSREPAQQGLRDGGCCSICLGSWEAPWPWGPPNLTASSP